MVDEKAQEEEVEEAEEEEEGEEGETDESETVDDDLDSAREAAADLAKLFELALPDMAQMAAASRKLMESFVSIDDELSNGGELPEDWAVE